MRMPRQRKPAAGGDNRPYPQQKPASTLGNSSSDTFAASSALRYTQVKEQSTIKFNSGEWKGLEIRFGKDYDLTDGFTIGAHESRLRFPDRVILNPLDLEYAVTFLFNSASGYLEATETLTSPGSSLKARKIIISRSACVNSSNLVVLKCDNICGYYVSTAFFIRIALKPNVEFDQVTIGDEWAAGEQADAMFLKAHESDIKNMRFLEVRIPNYQKKISATGGSLFSHMEVQKHLRVNNLDLEAFEKNNPDYNPSRFRRVSLSDEQIQICSLGGGVSQPIHCRDAATLATENRKQRSVAFAFTSPSARGISLISDYKQLPLNIPASVSRCAVGMDFGAEFEYMSVDDKLSFLDKMTRDAATRDDLENALLWIERYELAIELDETGGLGGKGYVREQTHRLGQLGCPFPVTDLIYTIALCRLQKRREVAVKDEGSGS